MCSPISFRIFLSAMLIPRNIFPPSCTPAQLSALAIWIRTSWGMKSTDPLFQFDIDMCAILFGKVCIKQNYLQVVVASPAVNKPVTRGIYKRLKRYIHVLISEPASWTASYATTVRRVWMNVKSKDQLSELWVWFRWNFSWDLEIDLLLAWKSNIKTMPTNLFTKYSSELFPKSFMTSIAY